MDRGNLKYITKQVTLSNLYTCRSTKTNKTNRYTRKNKKQTKRSEMTEIDHFRARMRLPIGTTSFGIALTPEMIENNARIEKEINQHIKDGYYKNWGL